MKIDLVCVPSDMGHGANDGSYYPIGLLTIGTHLKKHFPEIDIEIIDVHHDPEYEPYADIIGISASSTLNYGNVLKMAEKAKKNDAIVILGGSHASELTKQILTNRNNIIDFIIRDKGEQAFLSFVEQYISSKDYYLVPGLSWFDESQEKVVSTPELNLEWKYDDYLPLDFNLLQTSIQTYWGNFQKTINSSYDAIFIVFTHFGCGYKHRRAKKLPSNGSISSYCSYCSLKNELSTRQPENIINEALNLIHEFKLPHGSKILLKCYGDNMGPHYNLLEEIEHQISISEEWNQYEISWTFYMQSNYLTVKMAEKLKKVGTEYLFIGFDSANERIQKINALGTNNFSHNKCIKNCVDYNLNIQAAMMVGCAGENLESLQNNLAFAERLNEIGNLERINTSVCIVMPGAPNYDLLSNKEPWIKSLDYLETETIQKFWIKHFCPELSEYPEEGLMLLYKCVNEIDRLSPGPHSSMGYLSEIAQLQETL